MQNTKKSVNNWVKIFKQWAHKWSINPNLEEIDAASLDKVLSKFYAKIHKQDGREYEVDSLSVMESSLYCYLSKKRVQKSILKDQVFNQNRKILEGKARLLREQDMSKTKIASKAINSGEEDILWNYQNLGDSSSTSLVRTMWFL